MDKNSTNYERLFRRERMLECRKNTARDGMECHCPDCASYKECRSVRRTLDSCPDRHPGSKINFKKEKNNGKKNVGHAENEPGKG